MGLSMRLQRFFLWYFSLYEVEWEFPYGNVNLAIEELHTHTFEYEFQRIFEGSLSSVQNLKSIAITFNSLSLFLVCGTFLSIPGAIYVRIGCCVSFGLVINLISGRTVLFQSLCFSSCWTNGHHCELINKKDRMKGLLL